MTRKQSKIIIFILVFFGIVMTTWFCKVSATLEGYKIDRIEFFNAKSSTIMIYGELNQDKSVIIDSIQTRIMLYDKKMFIRKFPKCKINIYSKTNKRETIERSR